MKENFLERWKKYFNNNPKGYWFKRKLYGWGWTPVKWQGWVVMLVYIGGLVYFFREISGAQHSVSDVLLNFAPRFVGLSIIFLYIVYKTGETPKWQWGHEEESQ